MTVILIIMVIWVAIAIGIIGSTMMADEDGVLAKTAKTHGMELIQLKKVFYRSAFLWPFWVPASVYIAFKRGE